MKNIWTYGGYILKEIKCPRGERITVNDVLTCLYTHCFDCIFNKPSMFDRSSNALIVPCLT